MKLPALFLHTFHQEQQISVSVMFDAFVWQFNSSVSAWRTPNSDHRCVHP